MPNSGPEEKGIPPTFSSFNYFSLVPSLLPALLLSSVLFSFSCPHFNLSLTTDHVKLIALRAAKTFPRSGRMLHSRRRRWVRHEVPPQTRCKLVNIHYIQYQKKERLLSYKTCFLYNNQRTRYNLGEKLLPRLLGGGRGKEGVPMPTARPSVEHYENYKGRSGEIKI